MYKQIIIARKDLNMSPGKLSAQVSHGSMAFITTELRRLSQAIPRRAMKPFGSPEEAGDDETVAYDCEVVFDKDLHEQWIDGSFTKCVLQAKNRNHLMKAKTMAEELGMREGEDFFLIRDNCYTELEPEDEDGRTLTCIGFKPMDSELIDLVGKKCHLYM